jgi:hypothetical protein
MFQNSWTLELTSSGDILLIMVKVRVQEIHESGTRSEDLRF